MIEIFTGTLKLNLFLILIFNLALFYFMNLIILKKNFLIDVKNISFHKQLISKDIVPISGGIIILINSLLFNFFESFVNQIIMIIIFLIGFLADIQKFNSPLKRLVYQLFVILIFVSINELFIRSIRIDFFDFYLNYNLISIVFTTFCFLILINGSNFIDGSNLQCSGYYLAILTVLIFIDLNLVVIENIEIVYFLYPILISFVVYNFFNKSYLNDGGTYLLSLIIGYILINFQVNANISPYFIALFLWYPAFENLFSIIRRIFSKKLRPDKPDLLHLHHLIFKYINKNYKFNNNLKFSISGIILNFFNLFIFYIGSLFIYSTLKLLLLIFLCVSLYLLSYFILLSKLKIIND